MNETGQLTILIAVVSIHRFGKGYFQMNRPNDNTMTVLIQASEANRKRMAELRRDYEKSHRFARWLDRFLFWLLLLPPQTGLDPTETTRVLPPELRKTRSAATGGAVTSDDAK